MSLEQSIDKLTAALEAATGVLVALQAAGVASGAAAPAQTASAPAPAATGGRGRKAAPPPPAPAPAASDDSGLDDGGLDDGGLGDAPKPTGEETKKLVTDYRDAAIKKLGDKDKGLSSTRELMKKFVPSLNDINDDNCGPIHAAFSEALAKLK